MPTANYDQLFQQAGQQYGVDPVLLKAIAQTESGLDPKAVSSQGAVGLMQIMPGTAKSLGVDPTDPVQAIPGAARLMRENIDRYKSVEDGVAAYHGGTDQRNWGPKTNNYVDKVSQAYAQYKQQALGTGGLAVPDQTSGLGSDQMLSMLDKAHGESVGMNADDMLSAIENRGKSAVVPAATAVKPGAPPENTYLNQIKNAIMGPVYAHGDFSQALWHNAANAVLAPAQLAVQGATGLSEAVGATGLADKLGTYADKFDKYLQNREENYQKDVPTNVPSTLGAALGMIAPLAIGGVATGALKAGTATEAAGAQLAKVLGPKAGQYIAQLGNLGLQGGAASALTTPVTNGQNFADEKLKQTAIGAAIGPLAKLGLDVGVGVPSAIRNVVEPLTNPTKTAVNNILKEVNAKSVTNPTITPPAAGPVTSTSPPVARLMQPPVNPPSGVKPTAASNPMASILSNIAKAENYVPGVKPTVEQLAGDVGLVQLSKALQNSNPEFKRQFVERQMQNNSARLELLNSVAGTTKDMNSALAARENFSKPFYADLKAGHNVPIADIRDTAIAIKNGSLGTDPAVDKGLNELLNKLKGIPDVESVGVNPANLDGYRQNLSNYISENSAKGVVGSKAEAALIPLKNKIVESIEQYNPGYSKGLQQYAELSTPINTMEAAGKLRKAFSGRNQNAIGDVTLGANAYNNKLTAILKKQDYPIDPAAQQKLENIGQDLARESRSYSIPSDGSSTAYNLAADSWLQQKLYGQGSKDSLFAKQLGAVLGAATGTVSGGPMGAATGGYLGSKLGKVLAEKGAKGPADELGRLLLNPEEFIKELTKVSR